MCTSVHEALLTRNTQYVDHIQILCGESANFAESSSPQMKVSAQGSALSTLSKASTKKTNFFYFRLLSRRYCVVVSFSMGKLKAHHHLFGLVIEQNIRSNFRWKPQ